MQGGQMLRLAAGRLSYCIRGIAAGAILAALCALGVGLSTAAARDEQPFRRGKLVPSDTMEFAAHVGIPIAAGVGALLGLGCAQYLWTRDEHR